MTIKVIGAGFGRTGTMSLKAALEELGFDKCYHMLEVIMNQGHANKWLATTQGKPVVWDEIFEGYQATVDWPGCTFYKELMEHYPDAKVLLSVRDPERWYASTHATLYQLREGWFGSFSRFIPRLGEIPKLVYPLVWDGTFHGRFEDKPYAIDIFNQHIAEVKRLVPPERLLVYEVKQGWEPLCEFLNVPVPKGKPFPHLNDKAQIQQFIRFRRLMKRWLPVGLLVAFMLALVAKWMDR